MPDLNAAPPQPPQLPDLNAAPPQPPQLPDLNAALPQPPQLPDLNAALPTSPRPQRPTSGPSTPVPPAPDLLTLPYVDPAAFGLHGAPHPEQVFRLLDILNAHPEQRPRVLRVAADLLVALGAQPELRDGLEERWAREMPVHPATASAIQQLMDQLVTFERNDVESDDEEETDVEEELSMELARQTAPLSHEMARWMSRDQRAPAAVSDTFDEDPLAPAFARLLARLHEPGPEGSSTAVEQRAGQVAFVVDAISRNSDLREQVFLIAQTALGSCQDNLLEGFSKILLAVRDHQMVDEIRAGRVDAAQFHRWAGQQLRLSLLESEVTRFIHRELQRPDLQPWLRKHLTREPLETLVHAKEALRERLDLPDGTVSGMTALQISVLDPRHIAALEHAVLGQARDPDTYGEFMMGHSTWRAGMQALHPAPFQALHALRDADPIFVEDIPEDVAGQADYAERARQVEAHWRQQEDHLLRQLAGFDTPAPPTAAKPEPATA
ncbi:NEL-type E3 ubiquitin ligase domain-containing protein [Acidovorax sp. NCPPB 4044]|uniref:NEL-type E3 ubiquitin ligase domain-containing protein n=1 Tax=Acidovorax sp. NCPPB 4044 TaxID=2940490 RepID=UPI00230353D4|nr:NEL-type E3 ubiquitin ligase domain-containing protein [Acidovorax sp. NCPPB 4044]MDA8522910.1 NEL domain-containing protein [Acidovorax sp. NCPPB 4044]